MLVDLYEWPDRGIRAALRFGSPEDPDDLQESCIQFRWIDGREANNVLLDFVIEFNDIFGSTSTIGLSRWCSDKELPFVQGVLEGLKYNPKHESALYENRWIRGFDGDKKASNPKFVPEEQLTAEWIYRFLEPYEWNLKVVNLHGINVRPSLFQVLKWGETGNPYLLNKQEIENEHGQLDLKSFSRFLSISLGRDFNILPSSQRERWREENVFLGCPVAMSQDELDLFEALGEPNPVWWANKVQSRDWFRTRMGEE